MAKLTQEQLEKYRAMDREAFDFANQDIAAFFGRAADQGYSLDTTGFLAHPGFFQAPHRRSGEGADIAIVGSPLDLGAIGLAGARHGPQSVREWSRNYGPMNDVTGNIPFEQCSIIVVKRGYSSITTSVELEMSWSSSDPLVLRRRITKIVRKKSLCQKQVIDAPEPL